MDAMQIVVLVLLFGGIGIVVWRLGSSTPGGLPDGGQRDHGFTPPAESSGESGGGGGGD